MTDQEIKEKYTQSIVEWKIYYESKQDCERLDQDGYPTQDALDLIEKWHWDDAKGWFEFIHAIWYSADWGWKEKDEPHELHKLDQYKDKIVHRYYVSTAGWSGNESIIRAMQKNDWMWHFNWVQSRRGGHYIFELKEI